MKKDLEQTNKDMNTNELEMDIYETPFGNVSDDLVPKPDPNDSEDLIVMLDLIEPHEVLGDKANSNDF